MRSLGSVLDENKGLGPGFDFLRVALSISVVAWHSLWLATNNTSPDHTRILWFPGYAILSMFFALSGFLIAGSSLRLNLKNFLINRGLRIFPALLVEIVLSAFVLGAVFTSLPLKTYYTQPQTYHYLTNIVGLINYYLPGVFTNNPTNMVNNSLWTVPFELGCYAIMSTFMLSGSLRRPWLLVSIAIIFIVFGFLVNNLNAPNQSIFLKLANLLFSDKSSRLFVSFILGIVAYLWRYRIPYDTRFFTAAIVSCMLISLLEPAPWLSFPLLNLVVAPLTVYICIHIGATKIPPLPIFHRGDYSYGIYLYGCPIQQAVRALFPITHHFYLNFLISMPLITLFAMFSWRFIEKPILRVRKRFSFVARARGVEREGESEVGAPPPIIDASTHQTLSYGDISPK